MHSIGDGGFERPKAGRKTMPVDNAPIKYENLAI
jgi:hypothetical protein